MIDYSKLWAMLDSKKISIYDLIYKYNISSSRINAMKHGEYIRTGTLERLCVILSASPGELIDFRHSDELQQIISANEKQVDQAH